MAFASSLRGSGDEGGKASFGTWWSECRLFQIMTNINIARLDGSFAALDGDVLAREDGSSEVSSWLVFTRC
jgi:hypothetical protein